MHINNHPIPLVSIDGSSHDHQSITGHEIPYASYALLVSLVFCLNVKFQCFGAGENDQCTAHCAEDELDDCHGWWLILEIVDSNSIHVAKGELLDVAFTCSERRRPNVLPRASFRLSRLSNSNFQQLYKANFKTTNN